VLQTSRYSEKEQATTRRCATTVVAPNIGMDLGVEGQQALSLRNSMLACLHKLKVLVFVSFDKLLYS
jgi:hypothetical protein